MKHTPAPWTLELRAKHLPKAIGGHHTIRVENRLIATCPAHRLGGKDTPLCLEECEANARLMAAAPELLESLKWFVEACGYVATTEECECGGFDINRACGEPQCEHTIAMRAIAKAEGTDK